MKGFTKVYRSEDMYLGDSIIIGKDTILIGKKSFCPECKLCEGLEIKVDENYFPIPPVDIPNGCPYDRFRNL